MKFNNEPIPTEGTQITAKDGKLVIADNPIIPFIEGDGIGPDITRAMRLVVDGAIEKAYSGKKKIVWYEVYAGEKANEKCGTYMPEDTFDALRHFKVAIKGPLTTPVGGGFRSLNVTLRQVLDLYACVRPVRYYNGVSSPLKQPEKMDVVIFRENSEDVYSGIEWQQGTKEAKEIIAHLTKTYGVNIREDSGIGVKPISITGTKRLVRMAIQYAIENNRSSVTLMHKGNIMKFTEGAFRDWGYELAKEEFADKVITEDDVWEKHDGKAPEGMIVIKDRIADSMFQQILTRTDEYDVVATMNLNGDYFSDACAAQVGGLGLAPGANIGDEIGLFEATHGTAPKYAGLDKVNPGSLILSAKMMLDYMGWKEASALIEKGLENAIGKKVVTYDLARQMDGATEVSCSKFGEAIVENM